MNLPASSRSPGPAIRPSGFRAADLLFTAVTLTALFLLLTGGIPLIQAGWVRDFATKKHCMRIQDLATVLLFAPGALVWFFNRGLFSQWTVIRAGRAAAEKKPELLLGLITAILGFTLLKVSLLRHAALETRGFDLGLFAQTVWTTLHGDFLYSSLKGGICVLGDHVEPLLALLSPLYALWPDPRLLLVLQAGATAACVPLLYRIALRVTGEQGLALIFAIAYCFYLPLRSPIHEDFHPEVLIKPVLFLAFLALEDRKWGRAVFWMLLAASAKETMLTLTAALGLYAVWVHRRRGYGLAVFLVSALLLVWEVKVVVPHFSGSVSLYEGAYKHLHRFPEAWISSIFRADVWEYLLKIFIPFGLFSLLHPPTLMLTLPVIGLNVLSSNETYMSLNYHYTVGLAQFAALSAVYGFGVLLRRGGFWKQYRYGLLAGMLALSMFRAGPPEYFYGWESARRITDHHRMIVQFLDQVPSNLAVLSHNGFLAHLANRKFLYQFDYNGSPAKAETAAKLKPDLVIWDPKFWEPGLPGPEQARPALEALGYRAIFEQDGFSVFQKAS